LSTPDEKLSLVEQPQTATVAPSIRIRGEVSGSGNVLIEGSVEGPVRVNDGQLTIGTFGRLVGDGEAREILVRGQVKGNLKARDWIEMKKDASIVGDAFTARIMIEDGVQFKGEIDCKTSDTAVTTQAPKKAYAATATSKKI
jgi:cytoskeletal protein CcmA (bactofilin family)